MVYLPKSSYNPASPFGCAYGLAEVGTSLTSGGLLYVTDLLPSVMAHELGHNFGLEHSSEVQCDATVEGGSCRLAAYHDYYDVMGASWQQLGSLNVAQAARLGILLPAQQQAFTMTDAPTTVTLAPVSGTSGIRTARLTAPDGTVYWLEYRPASGQDAWLGTTDNWPGLQPGVLLRRWANSADTPGDGSLLFDGTPSAAVNWDSDDQEALPVGTPVRFADGVFTVTVTAQGATASVDVVPETPIAVAYAAGGGTTGPLGPATTGETCASGVCSRTYQNGVIYWSVPTGAHPVQGDILSRWTALGGSGGPLGLPVRDASCGLDHGGCAQDFQYGTLYSSPASGTHALYGGIRSYWLALGGTRSGQGYPTSEMTCGLRGGGCVQEFQAVALYWSPATGTQQVSGAIRAEWASVGAQDGWLGYPTISTTCGWRGGSCLQFFQGGVLGWSPAGGTHAVSGGILDLWAATGWANGWLGAPAGDMRCGLRGGGCVQGFQGGAEYWSPWTGTHAVSGGIGMVWAQQGWESGPLGYPVTEMSCVLVGGGCAQHFEGGSLYWSPPTGVHGLYGAIRAAWDRYGAENGLGYPTAEMWCDRNGCSQQFQRGRLTWSARTGATGLS